MFIKYVTHHFLRATWSRYCSSWLKNITFLSLNYWSIDLNERITGGSAFWQWVCFLSWNYRNEKTEMVKIFTVVQQSYRMDHLSSRAISATVYRVTLTNMCLRELMSVGETEPPTVVNLSAESFVHWHMFILNKLYTWMLWTDAFYKVISLSFTWSLPSVVEHEKTAALVTDWLAPLTTGWAGGQPAPSSSH